MRGYLAGDEHNHTQNPSKQIAEKKRIEMKEQARKNKQSKPAKIIAETRQLTSDEVLVELGSDSALERMIERKKNKIAGKINHQKALEIEIDMHEFPNTELIYDSKNDTEMENELKEKLGENRIFIFASEQTLNILRNANQLQLDGSFRAAPTIWKQLWVLGASIKKRMCCCVWALLPGKHYIFYRKVLEVVGARIAPTYPRYVMSDFEMGEIKAVKAVFPMATITLCLFHMSKMLLKHWTDMGLNKASGRSEEEKANLRALLRGLMSLAFLPHQHVRRAFSLLVDESPAGTQDYLMYFARNFIGLTEFERENGAEAFKPEAEHRRRSIISLNDSLNRNNSMHSFASSSLRTNVRAVTDFTLPTAISWGPSAAQSPNSFTAAPAGTSATPIADIWTRQWREIRGSALVNYSSSSRSHRTSRHTRESSVPSATNSHRSISLLVVPRWQLTITKSPRYAMNEWNVNMRARNEMHRTNNALEAQHKHFQKTLKHHPTFSDLLTELDQDIVKQVDHARSAQLLGAHKRKRADILQDQRIKELLENAHYETNEQLIKIVKLIGYTVKGYVDGLVLHRTIDWNEGEECSIHRTDGILGISCVVKFDKSKPWWTTSNPYLANTTKFMKCVVNLL